MKTLRLVFRMLVLSFLVTALLTAHGCFMPAGAEGPSQTRLIRSVKIKWTETDNDGIESRLKVTRQYDANTAFSMQYQIDFILTGNEAHQPGAVRVLVPKQIFHKRSVTPDGSVMAAGYGGVSFSVPSAPSASSGWHWEDTEDGRYVITNDVTIDAAAQVMFQCSVTNLLAPDLVDMRSSDPLSATVEVTDRAGGRDTMTSNVLTAVVDTEARLEKIENTSILGASLKGTVYATTDSVPTAVKARLPGGADTANSYIFVCWKTQPYYRATQYFSLDMDLWAGEAEGNGASIPGIALGMTGSSGRIYTQDSGEQAGQHYTRNAAAYEFDDKGSREGNRECSVWTAYPTAQMQKDKTYIIRSAAWWQMTEADPATDSDPQLVTREDANASVQYTHSGWEYPEGTFGVYKYTDSHPSHTHSTPARDRPDSSSNDYHNKNHTYDAGIGALRNDQSVSLEYEVLTVGYGYAYTAGPTTEVPDIPAGWDQDPSHYLNWDYMMETTDDELSIQHIAGNLQPGDYRFTELTVAAPEMFTYGPQASSTYQLPGSEYGYRPDSSLPRPAVEVWIKHADSSWELYRTVQRRSGTEKVRFPDDVIGYRTRIVSNQAACKLAVWPKVTLLPSGSVKDAVETVLRNYTYAVLDNNVRLKTLYYYGAEREDEVLPSQAAWLQAVAEENHMLETDDSSSATLLAAGFKVSGTARVYENDIENDSMNRRIRATLSAYVDEESNQTTEAKYNEAVAAGAIIPETSGIWYVLLPEKFTVNTSTVHLREGSGYNDHVTDVKVTENFRGTGRTMVEVHAALTPKAESYYGTTGYTDRIRIYMDVYLSWHDYNSMAASNRRHHDYYVAFESGNPGRLGNLYNPDSYQQTIGYPDAWPKLTHGSYIIYSDDLRAAMSDLDPATDEERFVYAKGNIDVGTPDVSEQVEFRKDVRYDGDGNWGKGTAGESQITVPEGGEYTYRLTVSAKHDSRTAGIILYDAIEEHVPDDETGLEEKKNWSGAWNGKGQWQGTLTSVDLSGLTGMNCAPKLYYSTRAGLAFGRENSVNPADTDVYDTRFERWDDDYRLSESTIWKAVDDSALAGGVWYVPDDVHVTAIAVDAQKSTRNAAYFQLNAGECFSVYLHMKAPDDGGNADCWNAKGAYAHKRDNASSTDDIDWVKASDPACNMYAYNAATVVFVPFSAPSGSYPQGQIQTRQFLNYRYDRVGIVPGTISVRKTWDDGVYIDSATGTVENYDGVRPDSVTIRLKGVTDSSVSPVIEDTLVLSADSGWQGAFLNAPERDSEGRFYTYTVTEDPVDQYTSVVRKDSGTNGRAYEIINRHEQEKVTITGKKLWLNPDGTPAEPDVSQVSMGLRRVNEQGQTEPIPYNVNYLNIMPSKENSWTYTFSGYDRYAMGGYEYKYILSETAPEDWFSQNDTPPAGVTVTAQYDPDDITSFRNFKKPDIGYAMIHTYVNDSSKPSEGNNAELPSFSFDVELKNGSSEVLDGEYEYILYDKGPYFSSETTLPADAVQIGSGTVRNDGTLTLAPEQCAVIIGLPGGTRIRVTEKPLAGWTARGRNNTQLTVTTGRTSKFTIPNDYESTGSVTVDGTKELAGREQRAREFTFEVVDGNRYDRWNYENSDYGKVIATVKTGESRGTVIGADGTVIGLAMFAFRPDFSYTELNVITEYGGSRTLHYLVSEKIPSGAQTVDGAAVYNGVTYDGRTMDVAVTLTDSRDGTLKVTAVTEAGTPLTFRNTYGLRKNIALTAHKDLVGRTLQPREFSFEVRRSGAAADSDPIATGTNDGEGNVAFTPEITLTEKDLAAASPETGVAEVTFLISEVQGTDPSVTYMTDPAEAKVRLAQKTAYELVAALPGQEIRFEEITCPACGGTGKAGGLSAIYINIFADPAEYTGEPFTLPGALDNAHMELCGACGGSGYDPDHPGQACEVCRGNGVDIGTDPIELPDGNILVPLGEQAPVEAIGSSLGMEYGFIQQTSAWVAIAAVVPAEEWTGSIGFSTYSYVSFVYYAGSSENCETCNGTKKAKGDPYAEGDALPVQLVNRVRTGVTFTADKTLDGQPASGPFEFVLLETDQDRTAGKEVGKATNGPDGKIVFDPVWLNAGDTAAHYYVIRETGGTDAGILYDSSEVWYDVSLNPDGTLKKELTKGDGVFRNETVQGKGILAIEVKTTGYNPPSFFWWFHEDPVFTVDVTLKDSKGNPLAGQPLPAAARNVRDAGPVTDENGHATLQIRGGGSAEITGLPDGTMYEAEQPADSIPAGFSQSSAEGASGTIRAGETSRAVFENAYQQEGPPETPSEQPDPETTPTDEPTPSETPTNTPSPSDTPAPSDTPEPTNTPKPVPKTGDPADPLQWLGILLAGLAGIVWTAERKIRKR